MFFSLDKKETIVIQTQTISMKNNSIIINLISLIIIVLVVVILPDFEESG